MAKTTVYEKGEGYDALRFRSYYESTNGKSMLRLAAAGAVIYILMVFVAFIAAGEGVIDFTDAPGRSAACITVAVVIGIMFVLIYTKIINRLIRHRYRNLRSSMVMYDIQKNKLMQTMQEGNTETVSD